MGKNKRLDLDMRFFSTEHLLNDISRRSVRGGVITMGAQAIKVIVQLGSIMVLARLLTPADFGLVAMVTAVTGFVSMFKDAGLSTATLQAEGITRPQVSTLFWVNVLLSLTLGVATAVMAPVIAWFYGEPRLLLITVIVAASFVFGGLTVQHQALLQRQMLFFRLAIVQTVSLAAGVAVAVAIAVATKSYWALVAMPIAQSIINAVGVWLACPWIPGCPQRGSGVRPMLRFGSNVTASSFLTYARRNLDNIFLGYIWGAASVGLYSKAYGVLMLPINQINGPLLAVTMPSLSRLSKDPCAYRRYYRSTVETMVTLGALCVCLAFVEAYGLIEFVLGHHWLAATPIFRALLPAAIAGILNRAAGLVFLSTGRSDKQLTANLYGTPVVLLAIVVGSFFGSVGVAIGVGVGYLIVLPPTIAYAYQDSPVNFTDLWASTWRPLFCGLLTTTALHFIKHSSTVLEEYILVRLLLGLAVYSISLAAIPSGRQFISDAINLIKSRPKPNNGKALASPSKRNV